MKRSGTDQEGMAVLRFHQPENVVLLCCNCHTLLDDPTAADVDQQLMFFLRDRALAAPHFAESVRAFVCREMVGNRRRRPVSDAALAPLFDWLKTAIERGTLPPPHRFTVQSGSTFWRVDLAANDIEYGIEPDPSIPYWNGKDFVSPPARPTDRSGAAPDGAAHG